MDGGGAMRGPPILAGQSVFRAFVNLKSSPFVTCWSHGSHVRGASRQEIWSTALSFPMRYVTPSLHGYRSSREKRQMRVIPAATSPWPGFAFRSGTGQITGKKEKDITEPGRK